MKSIKTQLLLISGVILFVISALFFVLSASMTSNSLTDLSIANLDTISNADANAIRLRLEGDTGIIKSITRRPTLTNFETSLESRVSTLEADIAVLKSEGVLRMAVGDLSSGRGLLTTGGRLNLNDSDELKKALSHMMKGEVYFGSPTLSPADNKFILTIGAPIFDTEGKPKEYLLMTRDGLTLAELVGTMTFGKTGTVLIIQAGGRIIGAADKTRVTSNENIIETIKKTSNDKNSLVFMEKVVDANVSHGSGSYIINGVKKLASFNMIPGTDWTMLATIEESEIMAPVKNYQITMGIISMILFIISLIIFYFFAQSISKPVGFAASQTEVMAQGDFTGINEIIKYIGRKDEIGTFARSLSDMKKALSTTLTAILEASGQVSSGANQISTTSQTVSSGASEQAASTEEVSSTMEQMASNIRQNADNALSTASIAEKTVESSIRGGKAVTETVSAMKEIASKISIIEDIASQTNLLALNAAIEAARAGEAGRGFAVVASEVRKLAERSQIAAGEISELSKQSVTVAEESGQLISSIVPDIQKTAELVQEITAASKEQDVGAQQINKAIMQMDTVTQQNASASEELASMAEELSAQAQLLQDAISFFKVEKTGQNRPQPAKKLPAPAKNASSPKFAAKTVLPQKTAEKVYESPNAGISDNDFEEF